MISQVLHVPQRTFDAKRAHLNRVSCWYGDDLKPPSKPQSACRACHPAKIPQYAPPALLATYAPLKPTTQAAICALASPWVSATLPRATVARVVANEGRPRRSVCASEWRANDCVPPLALPACGPTMMIRVCESFCRTGNSDNRHQQASTTFPYTRPSVRRRRRGSGLYGFRLGLLQELVSVRQPSRAPCPATAANRHCNGSSWSSGCY